jgi:hypothetical protein
LKIKGIDEGLKIGDPNLVNEIAYVKVGADKKPHLFFSFATKYCSHHQPLQYPIYDTYVVKVLSYFNKRDRFNTFNHIELKNHNKYKMVLDNFMQFYGLQQFNYKQIDQYLWLLGKRYYFTRHTNSTENP